MGRESKWDFAKGARLQQWTVGMLAGPPSSMCPRGCHHYFTKPFMVSILKIQYIEDLQTLKGQENTVYRLALLRKCLL